MRLPYYPAFLLLLSATLPGRAQQATVPAASPDTAGYQKGGYGKFTDRFYFGTLTKADGTEIQAYLPTKRIGYERLIDYFPAPVIQGELRHRHTLKMQKVKSMAVHGHLYETVQHNGKNTKILALNLLDGPIALSTYAEPRAIPIPIPLAAGAAMPIVGINLSAKNHWYLRRNGVCTEMHRGRFAELMSAYLSDNPTLASKVAHGEANYQYNNTPAIIAEYNRAKAAGGQ